MAGAVADEARDTQLKVSDRNGKFLVSKLTFWLVVQLFKDSAFGFPEVFSNHDCVKRYYQKCIMNHSHLYCTPVAAPKPQSHKRSKQKMLVHWPAFCFAAASKCSANTSFGIFIYKLSRISVSTLYRMFHTPQCSVCSNM